MKKWAEKRALERETKQFMQSYRRNLKRAMKDLASNDGNDVSSILHKDRFAKKLDQLLSSRAGQRAMQSGGNDFVKSIETEMEKMNQSAFRGQAFNQFNDAQKNLFKAGIDYAKLGVETTSTAHGVRFEQKVEQAAEEINESNSNNIVEDFYNEQIQKINNEIKPLKAQHNALQQQIDQVKQQEARIQTQIDKLSDVGGRKANQIEQLQQQILDGGSLENDLKKLEMDQQMLQGDIKLFVDSGVEPPEGMQKAAKGLSDKIANVKQGISHIERCQNKIEELSNPSRFSQGKTVALEQKLESLVEQRQLLEQDQSKVGHTIRILEHDKAPLKRDFDELKSDSDQLDVKQSQEAGKLFSGLKKAITLHEKDHNEKEGSSNKSENKETPSGPKL